MSAQYDIMPTIAELTGFKLEGPQDGISLLPTLLNKSQEKHDFLYWEFPEYGGQVAIRMGDYKLIRRNLKNSEPPTLELYDIFEDPQEKINIAHLHPNILSRAEKIFLNEHSPPEIELFKIPLLEKGLFATEK